MTRAYRHKALVVATVLLTAGGMGCTGAVDGADDGMGPSGGASSLNPTRSPNQGGPATPNGTDPLVPTATQPAPTAMMAPGGSSKPDEKPRAGTMPIRRLSRSEYNNSLRDLLGADGEPANEFASDSQGQSGFDEGALIAGAEMDRMMDTYERLARTAIDTRLTVLSPCDAAAKSEDVCAKDFIAKMGRRTYRHVLSKEEEADLRAVYDDAKKALSLDHKNALRLVLQAMLLSPRFNYHWVLGDRLPQRQGELLALDGFEIAARLSFFLWQSTPDDGLLDAAETGKLSTPKGMMEQAQRMLGDAPKASRGNRGFFKAWLDLDALDSKDKEAPVDSKLGFGSGIYAAMAQETMSFVDDLVLGAGDRKFQTLIAANHSFVNEGLAKVYGLPGVTGKEFRRVSTDPAERAGLLTHAGFIASTTTTPLATVIKRGRFLFERLATCAAVPAPEGTIPEPPVVDGTVREQLAAHSANGACRSCHQMMDPLGFAFMGFDSYGRIRTKDEKGRPLDTKGSFNSPTIGEVNFTGAVDLAKSLARSADAQACFAKQMFRYSLKKSISSDDVGSADALGSLFTKSGHDLRELLLAATQVFSFYYRSPSIGEVLQ